MAQDSRSAASRRQQRFEQRKAAQRRKVLWGIVAPLMVVGLVGVGLVVVNDGGDGGAEPAFAGTVLRMELGEFFIRGELTAPAGAVRVEAVNIGAAKHTLGIRRVGITRELQPGDSATLDAGTLAAGEYELFCDVPGHVEAGQVATLTIT